MTRTRRLWSALLVSALAPALMSLVSPAPATAISSYYLCTGYQGCRQAGYSDAGYGKASGTMYWRMYAGHNCTNYIAYRMIQNGMSSERPWSGSGMAYNWGPANRGRTDNTPRVGSVAWWARNAPGAGSSGHIAYVERVISSTEIVISEDSWSGDFHWRRIVKSSSGWPTGFIHFNDREVVSTTAPRVTGTPQVGAPLTAAPGGWKPAAGSRTYQWLANGKPVAGATAATFTPAAAQRGERLSVRVRAARQGYATGSAVSAAGAPVAPGELTTTSAPAVSGNPELDDVLKVKRARWSPAAESTSIRWRADGARIKGEKGRTLTLTKALAGAMITAESVAKRAGYTKAAAASAPVGPVVAGTIELVEPFTVSGRPRVGGSLSMQQGRFTPSDALVTHAWLRNGSVIAGATGATYQPVAEDLGARISARVTLSKQHYVAVTRTIRYDGIVTTRPQVKARAVGRKGAAVVKALVTAPGMTEPGGKVLVKVGSQEATARLVEGRARLVIGGLQSGQRPVTVTYLGTRTVESARVRTTVTVRR